MGRLIYRMCLVIVLVIAVAGGVYYYMTFYQKDESPQKGTFVNRMDDKQLDIDRKYPDGYEFTEAII